MLGLGNSITSGYIPFTLTSVSDLELWLQNGVGVTAAKWNDSSGNSNHATQATEGNQAAVSGGGLDFEADNSDHYDLASSISISQNGGFCMAIVFTRESSTAQAIFSDSSNEQLSLQGGGTTFRLKSNDPGNITTDAVFASGTFPLATKMIFLVNRSAGASNRFTFFKNGVALTADIDTSTNEAVGENPNGFDFDTLGASISGSGNFFDGIIHEVAFWSKGLSATEIADVNSYLKNVHGL